MLKLAPASRKRQLEKELNEDTSDNEYSEEFEHIAEPEKQFRKPVRKQCRRVSGVYREICASAKIGKEVKVLKYVFSHLPSNIWSDIASVSTTWCIVAYSLLRQKLAKQYKSGTIPFTRFWKSEPWEGIMYTEFNGDLHYHSELLTYGSGDTTISEVEAVITFATKYMENIFSDDEMKFPQKETVIYGLTDRIIVNNHKYWNPFSECSPEFGIVEKRNLVGSVFIPKSNVINIRPFSVPLLRNDASTDLCTKETMWSILLRNFGMEDGEELPSMQAILMFQYHEQPFLRSFIDTALQQDIAVLSGVFSSYGFNCNDDFSAVAVGISISSKTDDPSSFQISTYAICMSDPNPERVMLQIKEQCELFINKFVILLSSTNEAISQHCPEIPLISEEEYLNDDQYWYPRDDVRGGRSEFVLKGMQIFRSLMPDVPMIGAVTPDPLIMEKIAGGENMEINGPVDLGFLVVAYH